MISETKILNIIPKVINLKITKKNPILELKTHKFALQIIQLYSIYN